MNYSEIFEAYYTLYRSEAEVPTSEDDEYLIGLPLANEAINRWYRYDNTMWQELYSTLIASGDGTLTITTGTTEYDAPEDFAQPGGDVKIINSDGVTVRIYPIIPLEEVQFMGDKAEYAYFLLVDGVYTMNINPAPTAEINGFSINYMYYKKPTLFTTFNASSADTEMSDPYFIVHRMLSSRFRSSRNPYYASAKGDAEDSLRMMQLKNNSGTWANPWSLTDHSGSNWGS